MAAVAALAAAPTPRLGASTWNSATSVSSQSVAVRIACLFRSATYGFPYHGLLSTSGDFTLGNVTSLAGMGDDTLFLQMSTPIQPTLAREGRMASHIGRRKFLATLSGAAAELLGRRAPRHHATLEIGGLGDGACFLGDSDR